MSRNGHLNTWGSGGQERVRYFGTSIFCTLSFLSARFALRKKTCEIDFSSPIRSVETTRRSSCTKPNFRDLPHHMRSISVVTMTAPHAAWRVPRQSATPQQSQRPSFTPLHPPPPSIPPLNPTSSFTFYPAIHT